MVTKKSKSAPKTKTTKKVAKTTAKKQTLATRKTVHATEPYSPIFGVVLLIVCVIMGAVLLLAAIKTFIRATYGDSEHFAESYTLVEKDNLFKIKDSDEIISILEHGTGVVFLGFPSCPWCQAYAPMLNDLAKEYGISEIYYFDIKEDRENETETYNKIVSILSDYLQYDNEGNKRIYVPETAFVVDGEIVGNDLETSKETLGFQDPEEYWTEERIENWKENVGALMGKVKAAEGCTTSCNE